MRKVVLRLAVSLLPGIGALAMLSCGEPAGQQDVGEARAALQARVVYFAIPG